MRKIALIAATTLGLTAAAVAQDTVIIEEERPRDVEVEVREDDGLIEDTGEAVGGVVAGTGAAVGGVIEGTGDALLGDRDRTVIVEEDRPDVNVEVND